MARSYLDTARQAGRQMYQEGEIRKETLDTLNACMMPRQEYIDFTNGR